MRNIFILILFWACQGHSKNDEISNAKKAITYSDSIFKFNPELVKFYALVDAEKAPIPVINIDEWSEKEYESFVNVIKREEKIVAYILSPHSESGDWNNVYSYYFGDNGRLIAHKKYSDFFNSICVDGALTEKDLFIYDRQGKKIFKEKTILDREGRIMSDTSNCIFNYRLKMPVYMNIKEIPFYQSYQ